MLSYYGTFLKLGQKGKAKKRKKNKCRDLAPQDALSFANKRERGAGFFFKKNKKNQNTYLCHFYLRNAGLRAVGVVGVVVVVGGGAVCWFLFHLPYCTPAS